MIKSLSLPGTGEGRREDFTKGNSCPAFRQEVGGVHRVSTSTVFQLPSVKIILMPKWHVIGWHVLILFTP